MFLVNLIIIFILVIARILILINKNLQRRITVVLIHRISELVLLGVVTVITLSATIAVFYLDNNQLTARDPVFEVKRNKNGRRQTTTSKEFCNPKPFYPNSCASFQESDTESVANCSTSCVLCEYHFGSYDGHGKYMHNGGYDLKYGLMCNCDCQNCFGTN